MNKQSIITILLTLLMSMTGEKVLAHDIEVANNDGVTIYYVWANEAETELAVSYRGSYGDEYSNEYSGNVVIPESVEYNGYTYPITSIGMYAFYFCSGLTSITIPNSVTSIDNWAFHYCSGLTAVTIGNSVTSIGYCAFFNCSGLTSVTIPNSVTSIGDNAFECSGLTSVTIGNSVTSIERDAFRSCSGLTSVNISDLDAWCNIGFRSMYSNPLYYAQHLYLNGEEIKDLVIPNSVTSVGSNAFIGCRGLTSITIPNSVTSIGESAFTTCTGVTSVTIGNSVTSIGSHAFGACFGLTSVTIPSSVTYIGNDAFAICDGLTSVNISDLAAWCNIEFWDNPLSYAHHLYINGNEITNLVIPNDVKSIGRYAFYNCSGLTSVSIPNSVTSIGDRAFSGCSGLSSITIPNSVSSIGDGAFSGCSGLSSITIPNSVTSFGGSAFDGTAWYNNQPDGLVYAGKFAYTYKGEMATDAQIMIKDGTLGIADYAFSDRKNLNSITIPNSVTSIGKYAFQKCSGLTSVTIPNSVTSIGSDAFMYCSGLTSVTIPNSVSSIGDRAFSYCTGLTSVTIGSGITIIGGYAFAYCQKLSDVTCLAEKLRTDVGSGEGLYSYTYTFYGSNIDYATLHVPAAAIEAYKATAPWSGFKSIVAIGEGDTPEIPETPKCATPEISYANGKVSLSCETENVEFISEVTVEDAKEYYDSEFTLSQTYKITVYATKVGYENSDVATREIVIENGQSSLFCDLNKDGKVNVADHVKLSDIIMNK